MRGGRLQHPERRRDGISRLFVYLDDGCLRVTERRETTCRHSVLPNRSSMSIVSFYLAKVCRNRVGRAIGLDEQSAHGVSRPVGDPTVCRDDVIVTADDGDVRASSARRRVRADGVDVRPVAKDD